MGVAYTLLVVSPLLEIEEKGLQVAKRGNFFFIFNFSQEKKPLPLPKEYQELITGKRVKGKVRIEPKELVILKE